MSADDNDPRHLESARGLLATSERMLANNRARNQRLSADNDDLRARIAALTAALASARVLLLRTCSLASMPESMLDDIHRFVDGSRPSPAQERTFEHPGAEEVFNSLRAARASSPAPCSGCAAARDRIKGAIGALDKVTCPATVEWLEAWLKEHP